MIDARCTSEVCDHSSKAALAEATALSTSSLHAKDTLPWISPVAGL
jgi:hypothetical protein